MTTERQDRQETTIGYWEAKITAAVADRNLVLVVVRRVALAAADGIISRSELDRILLFVAKGRRSGTIENPGGYFVSCAKDLFRKAHVPWSTARRSE